MTRTIALLLALSLPTLAHAGLGSSTLSVLTADDIELDPDTIQLAVGATLVAVPGLTEALDGKGTDATLNVFHGGEDAGGALFVVVEGLERSSDAELKLTLTLCDEDESGRCAYEREVQIWTAGPGQPQPDDGMSSSTVSLLWPV